jgi:outer membrane receptor protein involved in Fe transport
MPLRMRLRGDGLATSRTPRPTRRTMMQSRSVPFGIAALVLALVAPAAAQEFRGRINGTVTDHTGAVLPGVTVTATSPALIQPQTQVTGEDGTYRFIALPAGVYTLTFELQGFQTLKREGIRVLINQTLTVDAQLNVATLAETITVSGESPVVDTSTTTVGTNFTKELLTEIPNARDIWAAMAQAPSFYMVGYDVGGSHTGTQTGYITYGVPQQNTTRIEGVNTTEGTSANAGYFDFGSFEEFQLGGAGNLADHDVPGASLNITVKSGGDRFSGMWYSDYESDATISDNVPDAFRTRLQKDRDGFFTRAAGGLQRGNPITKQYDINANLGGPIWKGKAWFFYSYRLNDQYKTIIGLPDLARSKLSNLYTFKGTFQLSRGNQIIGYLNKREKLQDKRDLGPATPLSASYYQSSRNYPMKIEWTSVLGSRAFLDVLVGQWYNFFPLRPQTEVGNWPIEQFVPGRIELTTGQYFDGGANDYYQDQKRFKPQFHASLAYYREGWRGTHDFKFGFEARRDRRKLFNDQPFDIFYRDRNGLPSEVDLYNTPVEGINDVNVRSAYAQDTWKVSPRLTLNLGVRVDRYVDGWPEQSHRPNGIPALANATDPRIRDFFAPKTIAAEVVSRTTTVGPRAGFAFDLHGDGRAVVKGFYGRFYFNSADVVADNQNPVGLAQLRYRFNDLNGNRLLDGPQELGRFVQTVGGAGFVRIDRDLIRPSGNEVSTSLERELVPGLSGRVSYVYKNLRDVWGEIDAIRAPLYTIPITITDPGPDNRPGTGDERTFATFDRPATADSDRVYTNRYDSDYHTIEMGLNRRFANGWMVLTSFGYTWRFEGTEDYRPFDRFFVDENGQEQTTLYHYKLIGRYTLPLDIGLSASWKYQSGQQWGRTISVTLPGDSTRTIRVEPLNANRAPDVSIIDFRLDKSFRVKGTRLTAMVDVFNAANAAPVTSWRTTTVNYKEVTGILDPRIVRFGVRFEF